MSWLTTELVFHFKDDSLHHEITVFSQQGAFRLLTDHLVQKGPSFPHPIEVTIDATKGDVLVHSLEDGKQKLATEHLDIPEDAANPIVHRVSEPRRFLAARSMPLFVPKLRCCHVHSVLCFPVQL